MSALPITASTPTPRTTFWVVYAALYVAMLVQLWWSPYLPMQDAPQHLFTTEVNAALHDPRFNYAQAYRPNVGLHPYMLDYAVMRSLQPFAGSAAGGKLVVTLCILAYAALGAYVARWNRSGAPPWMLLLLAPAVYSVFFYFGFLCFLLSVPLVLLALVLHRDLLDQPSRARYLTLWLLLGALYFGHPSALAFGVGLAVLQCFDRRRSRARLVLSMLPWLASAAAVLIWLAIHDPVRAVETGGRADYFEWVPPTSMLFLISLPLGGMWPGGFPDVACSLAWGAVMAVVALALRDPVQRARLDRPYLMMALAYVFLAIALPNYVGPFAYVGFRPAAFAPFLFLAAVSRLHLARTASVLLALAAVVLVTRGLQRNHHIALETAEITPLFASMQPNARVLSIASYGGSTELHPVYLHELHSHDPFYYHLAVGGGANSALFDNSMMSVRYREGFKLPQARPGTDPLQLRPYYDYILWRERPETLRQFPRVPGEIARTAHWLLIKGGASQH